jgi:hypothetical protein
VFYIGIIAAVFIALAGLGACDTAIGSDGPGEQVTPIGAVDAQGLVEVRVALPASSGGDARSVTDGYVPVYVDYYEVIFKKHGVNEYYFASAEVGKAYLSISLLPGEKFDILLLAGIKANRVLLAAAFVDNNDGVTGTGNGTGFTVTAGVANVIKPTMQYTNLTPDAGEDITFAATNGTGAISATYLRSDPEDGNIATVTVAFDADPKTFTVELAKDKLAELCKAQGTGGDLTLEPNTGLLKSRYSSEAGKFGTPIKAG